VGIIVQGHCTKSYGGFITILISIIINTASCSVFAFLPHDFSIARLQAWPVLS